MKILKSCLTFFVEKPLTGLQDFHDLQDADESWYKPKTMFSTDRGHHAYWHHHHTGGGLAIVFAALTES